MFFLHFTRLPQAILSCHHSCCVACYVMDKRGGEEPLTFLQQCDNIDLVWIEIKKMNLVVKQWTDIHKPFYDFLKNAAYFFSFKLIKFNKRKIAKIEIGCYVMNWREEPLTFPQECSNMCLALQMHKRSFQVPKNHNFAPKIFGIRLNGHCFFGTLPRCCLIIVIYPAYNNSP